MVYEAHITMKLPTSTPQGLASLREQWKTLAREHGWKTSAIDGDPVMGDEVFFYFTSYGDNADRLLERMTEMGRTVASATGCIALRMKIEHVIYDTKTGIDWRERG
jgi:hypothetical protein